MKNFKALYLPIGVPTFHKESIEEQFRLSVSLLNTLPYEIECPEAPLLTMQDLQSFIYDKKCDLLIIQNNAFANSEYAAEILREIDADILLWTLQEPVIDGGRLRLNSLTGAYSAGNYMYHIGKDNYEYVWGAPTDEMVIRRIKAVLSAAKIKKDLKSMTLASIGHTPQGFGFGRSLDAEVSKHFGMRHITIEARELMSKAKTYDEQQVVGSRMEANKKMISLDKIPEQNTTDFVKLYQAYREFVETNNVHAISSRCWPDFFVDFGTPVCGVLGLLNDNQIAAACEADDYGAVTMLIGMRLSNKSVFFGDPVSLDRNENTITYWHCGTAACSLAHPSKGAQTGVHPNRKIGPTMEFGSKPSKEATVFRIGRNPDGTIRFFLASGEILDKEQQFLGTSLVFRSENPSYEVVDRSVRDGWEPHFAVIYEDIAEELEILGKMLGAEVIKY